MRIFYSHRPDPGTPLEETVGALVQAVRSGKALYAGVSSYPPDLTRRAADLLAAEGVPLLLHQPRYNLFDRWVEDGLSDVLLETGAGCIAFCPLAQGLLTNRYLDGIASGSRASKSHGFLKADQITEEKLRRIRALDAIARGRGQSLAELALAWVLSRPAVTSVLIGASRVSQIEDNVAALENTALSPDEIREIDAACLL